MVIGSSDPELVFSQIQLFFQRIADVWVAVWIRNAYLIADTSIVDTSDRHFFSGCLPGWWRLNEVDYRACLFVFCVWNIVVLSTHSFAVEEIAVLEACRIWFLVKIWMCLEIWFKANEMDFLGAFTLVWLVLIFEDDDGSDAFVFLFLSMLGNYSYVVLAWPDLVELVLHI